MMKMVKELAVGDKVQTIKSGIVEVVSIQFVPFPKVGANCMTAEGNYYVLGLKKQNGVTSVTRNNKPNDKKEVVQHV